MSEPALVLSPAKYYEEAKNMLEKKDFVEFVSKISNAILLAGNDKEMLAKTTYLRAMGLISFNQYSKALECIEEALEYNIDDVKVFELKKNKGLALGYLGEINEALGIFKELIAESSAINLIVGVYINIAWIHFTLTKNTDEHTLEEVKHYFDSVEEHFESFSNKRKWKVRNIYSVYYFYKKDYEKAIENLENSIMYCEEEDLSDVYNNLAELYIKIAEEDHSAVSEVAKEYLEKAEILGTRYNKTISLGYTFYFRAGAELMEEQFFSALETLYLALEHFKEAEATVMACECLVKINELMDEHKHNGLKALKENIKNKLKDTPYYEKV